MKRFLLGAGLLASSLCAALAGAPSANSILIYKAPPSPYTVIGGSTKATVMVSEYVAIDRNTGFSYCYVYGKFNAPNKNYFTLGFNNFAVFDLVTPHGKTASALAGTGTDQGVISNIHFAGANSSQVIGTGSTVQAAQTMKQDFFYLVHSATNVGSETITYKATLTLDGDMTKTINDAHKDIIASGSTLEALVKSKGYVPFPENN